MPKYIQKQFPTSVTWHSRKDLHFKFLIREQNRLSKALTSLQFPTR